VQVAARRHGRSQGACATPAPQDPGGCASWLERPAPGGRPFAKPVRYRLGVRYIDSATGEVLHAVEASLAGGRAPAEGVDQRLARALLERGVKDIR